MHPFFEGALARVPRLYARLVASRRVPNVEKLIFLGAVRRGDTVVEVGANIGYYTVLFSHLAGRRGTVHAFEPVRPTFERLTANVVGRRRFNNVRLEQLALADAPKAGSMLMPGYDHGQASLARHEQGSWLLGNATVESFPCVVDTLDAYCERVDLSRLDFLKCDAEGAELLVLRGSSRTLERFHPMLHLEICGQWTRSFGYEPAEIPEFLQRIGYDTFYLSHHRLARLREPRDLMGMSGSANLLCLVANLHGDRLARLPIDHETWDIAKIEKSQATGTGARAADLSALHDGVQNILTPSRNAPSVGVVVTNHNTWGLTRRCLDAVLALGEVDRILVVDDASDELPPALSPRVDVLVNERNLGLCRSLNRGVAACDTDIVTIFDSDAYPLRPFATQLREAFSADGRLAILGFSTVGSAGTPTASSEPAPDALGLVLGQRLDAMRMRRRAAHATTRGDFSVYTCAMAVRRAAFDQVGGFDGDFDWLDLDHDLSMRLRGAGWRLDVAPSLLAFHEGGGTPQRTSERVARYYRNRWLLLHKHGRMRYPRLIRTLVSARLLVELTLLAALGRISPARFTDKLHGRRLALRRLGLLD